MTEHFDVIVIGAAQAGLAMAARCGRQGLNTVVVERDQMGGTCVNNGCIPTTSDLEKSSMLGTAFNGSADDATGVIPMRKSRLLDLNAAAWRAEKAEGLALVDANTLALVNDSDFGLRNQVFDASGIAISGADINGCRGVDQTWGSGTKSGLI